MHCFNSLAHIDLPIQTFSFELPIFLREHHNGMYRTDVYFLCKTLVDLFFFILLSVISIAIPYYVVGLNPDVHRFFVAVGIIILVSNVASSFGLNSFFYT